MDAIFVCERWGATAKVQHIRTTYATVLAASGRYDVVNPGISSAKKSRSGSGTEAMFSADLETIVQASQAIANEVIFLWSFVLHSFFNIYLFLFIYYIILTRTVR
jgi:hypothetical protein